MPLPNLRTHAPTKKEEAKHVNQEEAWLKFKEQHPKMLEETLGKPVTKVFDTITKSGLLGRFGANANAAANYETLTQIFTEKAFKAGWTARENESLTTVITENEAKQ